MDYAGNHNFDNKCVDTLYFAGKNAFGKINMDLRGYFSINSNDSVFSIDQIRDFLV